MLKIKDLEVQAEGKTILKDFNLEIPDGEIHVLMGPNGSGKSTICKTILKHPDYKIVKGNILFDDYVISDLDVSQISRLGIFLLNQNPVEIEGITNSEMIRAAISEKTQEKVDIFKFNKKLNQVCELINLPKEFVHRDINFNMSGGEKKKNELLHLFMLEPKFIILDEIDSGLDVDALRVVGKAIRTYYEKYHPSIFIVTHHGDILKHFDDYKVHVMRDMKIIDSGGKELAGKIEEYGFQDVIRANEVGDLKNHE